MRKNKKRLFLVLKWVCVIIFFFIITSCRNQRKPSNKTKDSVKIGNQVWMTQNLNVSNFRNGDTIPEIKNEKEWEKAVIEHRPGWCYYEYDSVNGKKYGKLYNWFAVSDSRGLAPKGWHIPSFEECNQLIIFLDKNNGKSGVKMKSKEGWKLNGNGTNESGFSGLPGGFRVSFGKFDGDGYTGIWWSSNNGGLDKLWGISLSSNGQYASNGTDNTEGGLSVRCIKDE